MAPCFTLIDIIHSDDDDALLHFKCVILDEFARMRFSFTANSNNFAWHVPSIPVNPRCCQLCIQHNQSPTSRHLGTYYMPTNTYMNRSSNKGPLTSMNTDAWGSGRRSGPRLAAEDNIPHRFELFLLGDGEKKVTEEADTRIPNSSIFTFNKEDHTLGNLLRARLLQSPHVTFSGYKVPHPLFSRFTLRVQTDGSLTPKAALMQACKDLVSDLSILSREFTKEWELRKMVGDGGRTDEKDGKTK